MNTTIGSELSCRRKNNAPEVSRRSEAATLAQSGGRNRPATVKVTQGLPECGGGLVSSQTEGTLQGAPLSNVLLDELDR